MIKGAFRDEVADSQGRVTWRSEWRDNTIVHSAWPVMAGLLRNDASMRGILFLAVGTGDPAWDGSSPAAMPGTTRLHAERERRAVASGDFAYVDARGTAVARPTGRLEITARLPSAGQAVALREFGLVGGNATAARDSGYLINYVVHPRVDLAVGQTLTRRVRFTLHPESGRAEADWLTLPAHWLAGESPRLLDGVGDAFDKALEGAAVGTIGQLAESEPDRIAGTIPLAKAVELRSKARLAIRAASSLESPSVLAQHTVWDVIATPWAELVEGRESEVAIQAFREKVGALQLALDSRFLKRVRVGELDRGVPA